MADPDYSPEQRSRNQLSIVLTTAAFLGVVLISGTIQDWPASSIVGAFAITLVVALTFWWLFASRNARPLPTDRKHARWPYLSKKKWEEITGDK